MSFTIRIATALLIAATLCANASARARLAPADEYFGRTKMSVLEIRNRIHDLERRQDASVPHDAGLTEDAIRDWQRKYPGDPWLPKDIASLARIYSRYHAILARHITH